MPPLSLHHDPARWELGFRFMDEKGLCGPWAAWEPPLSLATQASGFPAPSPSCTAAEQAHHPLVVSPMML